LSKAYTATIIMRLEQDGVLHTTDKIGDLLQGVPPDKKEITVQQLLTHTSVWGGTRLPKDPEAHTRDDVLAIIFASRLRSQPGAGPSRIPIRDTSCWRPFAEIKTGRSYRRSVADYVAKPAHGAEHRRGEERAREEHERRARLQ
jgi:CubicO group peptidase (beta-lactamase class C family)